MTAPDPPELEQRLAQFEGALAFDIGAHVGYVAQRLAGRFDEVVALEPHPKSHARLRKLASPSLFPLPLAVGPQCGLLTLGVRSGKDADGQLVDPQAAWAAWGEDRGVETVPCLSVDRLRAIYGPPDLVKVDTEGGELGVIQGATATIRSRTPAWFIEVHDRGQGERIGHVLERWKYQVETVRHPHYEAFDEMWVKHYWLIAHPPTEA